MTATCLHPRGPDASGHCGDCGLDLPPVSRTCLACGATRLHGRFCEACGQPDDADSTTARPPAGWIATVSVDREWFDATGAVEDGVPFPGERERRLALTAASLRIGRRSRRDPVLPDIDLTGPPTDPGVSRRHARLLWEDHGWTLLDLASTNGTYVNGSSTPITAHAPTMLASGDRVGLGLWTCIRISDSGPAQTTRHHGARR